MFHAGQQIGVYVLIERLGKGGFGEVWLAEKRSGVLNKKVAIKLPHAESVDLEAIKQEAELWEQVSKHENVLTIFDADIFDGQVAIISEYAEGGSLDDKLKRDGKFPVEQAVEMTIGILKGLDHLHSKYIIHRDIKPQNILLQGNTPRLADFGISRAMNTSNISSVIIGTDSYMAPEALDGVRNVQTDIWSVGVVLYQLLKGSLPFPQEHYSERMFAIVTKDFAPLPDEIPYNLKAIVKQALSKNPAGRFQSAEAMCKALNSVLTFLRNPTFAPTEIFSIPVKPAADPQNTEEIQSVVTKNPFTPPSRYEVPQTAASPQIPPQYNPQNNVKQQERIPVERKMAENINFQPKIPEPLIKKGGLRNFDKKAKIWLFSISMVFGLFILIIISLAVSDKSANNANTRVTANNANRAMPYAANTAQNRAANSSTNELSDTDYYNRGRECDDNKEYDCAIRNYTKAIELNPQSYWYRLYRGTAYQNKANYDQSIKDFDKAIELNPEFSNPYSSRCLSYYYKKNYDQVIKDCGKAISLDSSDSAAYANRGIAYDEKGLYELALSDINKAIELNPDSAINYNNRGVVYEHKNYNDLAITDYRKSLSIDPDYKTAKDNLDRVLKKKSGE